MSATFPCQGFAAAGVVAGIKKNQKPDLGLIFSEVPATVAGVFTRNRVQAAPVLLSRQRLAQATAQAVVVNAGNANCCTGPQGMTDALAMAAAAAAGLHLAEDQVLVASTGVIGLPLPMDKINISIPQLVADLEPQGFERFAQAIMTTDTVPKLIHRQGHLNGRVFNLVATAKGAGMIRPDMATMLCFICTDLGAPAVLLQEMLTSAVDQSLNCITIDGDTSTNDTVLLLANGKSGAQLQKGADRQIFQALLDMVLRDMARLLVKDGEGVTKVVELKVQGALSDRDARCVADTVAHSPLVKTAFFGEDANWGRILAAAGRAGVTLDPDRVAIFFNEVQMVTAGRGLGLEVEAQATAVMKLPEFSVTLDLGLGHGRAAMLTCDFSVDYVKINANYRS